jgi:hypothetical protein
VTLDAASLLELIAIREQMTPPLEEAVKAKGN